MAAGGGRDRKKANFWRRLVEGQRGGGLSVRAWCARHGVRESSFYWWRRALARRDAANLTLVPVRVTPDSPAADTGDALATHGVPARIEIVWPDRRCVRVVGPVDRQALGDVLAVLAAAESAAC